MIISTDAEKALDKIQHPFMIKTAESGHRVTIPQHNKPHIWQNRANNHIYWWKQNSFPLKSGTRQRCPLLPLLFDLVLEVLAMAIREENEMTWNSNEKEVKFMSLFANDVTLYIKIPKNTERKLLEFIMNLVNLQVTELIHRSLFLSIH